MPRCTPVLGTLLTAAWLAACGGTSVYRPGASAGFSAEPDHEIDDDDIRRAFEARPQLRTPARVAVMAFGDERIDEIEDTVRALDGVADVYRIPTLLGLGQARGDGARPWWQHGPRAAPSIEKLRLLAARARCDLLMVFDYGYAVSTDLNGLAALNLLVLPVFFSPYVDVDVTSAVDVYVFDVRNGFLYAQVTTDEASQSDYHMLFGAEDVGRALRDAQWTKMLARLRGELARTLAGAATGPAAPHAARTP